MPRKQIKRRKPREFKELAQNENYWISPQGKVRSKRSGKNLKTKQPDNVVKVTLHDNKKARDYAVNKLVYSNFSENIPENFDELRIIHLDDDFSNCNIENLKLATQEQYYDYLQEREARLTGFPRLEGKKLQAIYELYRSSSVEPQQVAQLFGISEEHASYLKQKSVKHKNDFSKKLGKEFMRNDY